MENFKNIKIYILKISYYKKFAKIDIKKRF